MHAISWDRQRVAATLLVALIASACSGAATSQPGASTGPAASSQPGASTAAAASSEPAASPSAAASDASGTFCTDVAAFKSSVQALTSIDLAAVGTDGLQAAVADVATAAQAMAQSAKGELAPTVAELQTQIGALKTAVDQMGQGGAGSGLIAVGAAVSGLASAATTLEEQLKTACP